MDRKIILDSVKKVREISKKRKFDQTFDISINLKQLDFKNPNGKIDLFLQLINPKSKRPKICALVDKELSTKAKIFDKVVLKDDFVKYKKDKKIEAYEGMFIEKRSFIKVLDDLENRNVYLLDKKGEDVSKIKIGKDPVFIIGDHEGIPKKVKKYILKNKNVKPINIGPKMYFASHVVVILNNILDRNEI